MLASQSQFFQDLVGHILVLPRSAGQTLELNAVQREHGHLDDENLKL